MYVTDVMGTWKSVRIIVQGEHSDAVRCLERFEFKQIRCLIWWYFVLKSIWIQGEEKKTKKCWFGISISNQASKEFMTKWRLIGNKCVLQSKKFSFFFKNNFELFSSIDWIRSSISLNSCRMRCHPVLDVSACWN